MYNRIHNIAYIFSIRFATLHLQFRDMPSRQATSYLLLCGRFRVDLLPCTIRFQIHIHLPKDSLRDNYPQYELSFAFRIFRKEMRTVRRFICFWTFRWKCIFHQSRHIRIFSAFSQLRFFSNTYLKQQ